MPPIPEGSERIYPCVEISLDKVATNVTAIVTKCRELDIEVTAVTKVVVAHPALVEVLLEAGVARLADSRLDNLRSIRWSGWPTPASTARRRRSGFLTRLRAKRVSTTRWY